MDIGIGTGNPFGIAAARGASPYAMLSYCQRLGMSGVSFAPYSNNEFGGVRLSIHPHAQADLTALDVFMLAELNRQSGGRVLSSTTGSKLNLFHKVYGSESLYQNLRRGVPPSTIVAGWQRANDTFRARRQRYLLYP